jgi:hypothetical protein
MFAVLLAAIALWPNPDPLPALGEVERFPCHDAVTAALDLNYRHGQWLEAQQLLHPWQECWWRERREANDAVRRAWECLSEAQRAAWWYNCRPEWQPDEDPRRRALYNLRAVLGAEAWFSGRMPPPIPASHLHPIR